jgi:hypothetical protein
VVCAPLECERSVEKLNTAGRGDCRVWVDFTFASGGEKSTGPVVAGGFGNLFLDLNWRTLPDELAVDMLDMLPVCTRGSADCDRSDSSGSGGCWRGKWPEWR